MPIHALACQPCTQKNVRSSCQFASPSSDLIPDTSSMTYLGAALNSNASLHSELSRKFGRAWGEFRKLVQLWKHTSLPLPRKIEIFQAVITSQVMYGLSSAWLTTADQRRLDGFQAPCLRVPLRVAPSYVSRIANKTVLTKAQQIPYTRQLVPRQLLLFGKVARASDTDVLRRLTFVPGTLEPALNSCSTRKHVLLFKKKACLLVQQGNWLTRRHVFVLSKKTRLLARQENMPSC